MMYTNAQECLADHGIRMSVQRLAVMDFLMKNRTHPTVDQIFTALAPEIATLSRTTVYNAVSELSERGAIRSINIEEGVMRYDGDMSEHAHFICKYCGAIHDIELDRRQKRIHQIRLHGKEINDVQITFKGVCEKCNKL